MLKLPKLVLASPAAPRIEALFVNTERQLRAEGSLRVANWRWSPALAAGLADALRTEQVVRGLDAIAKNLDRELKGLRAVQNKTQQQPVARLSRLLFLTTDGSDRFYREAETILQRHGERTWGVLLKVDATKLGTAIHASPTKAVMIADRKAVESFLLTLVQSAP